MVLANFAALADSLLVHSTNVVILRRKNSEKKAGKLNSYLQESQIPLNTLWEASLREWLRGIFMITGPVKAKKGFVTFHEYFNLGIIRCAPLGACSSTALLILGRSPASALSSSKLSHVGEFQQWQIASAPAYRNSDKCSQLLGRERPVCRAGYVHPFQGHS